MYFIHLDIFSFDFFSARYRNFLNNKIQQPKKNVSRIIVFIIGGVTFSEIRSAYEIAENLTNWEIIIGYFYHIFLPIIIFLHV